MQSSSATNSVFQSLLGEYEKDATTCIYGPGGSGKTLLCLLSFLDIAKQGKKVVFVDTEGGFNVNRLEQLCPQYKNFLQDLILFKITSFEELSEALQSLSQVANKKIGLIIVDTMTNFYRLNISQTADKKAFNALLGQQLDYLSMMRKRLAIPIIITTQVYSAMEEEKVKPVGGYLIKGRCKTLIELEKLQDNQRKAVLIKSRYEESGKQVLFQIVSEGIIIK